MEDVIYSKYSWLHWGANCDFHRLRCQTESLVIDSWRVQIIPCLAKCCSDDKSGILHFTCVWLRYEKLLIFPFGEHPLLWYFLIWSKKKKKYQTVKGEKFTEGQIISVNHLHLLSFIIFTTILLLSFSSSNQWSSCCYWTVSCQGFSTVINYSYLAVLIVSLFESSLSLPSPIICWISSLCISWVMSPVPPLCLPVCLSVCMSSSFFVFIILIFTSLSVCPGSQWETKRDTVKVKQERL